MYTTQGASGMQSLIYKDDSIFKILRKDPVKVGRETFLRELLPFKEGAQNGIFTKYLKNRNSEEFSQVIWYQAGSYVYFIQ